MEQVVEREARSATSNEAIHHFVDRRIGWPERYWLLVVVIHGTEPMQLLHVPARSHTSAVCGTGQPDAFLDRTVPQTSTGVIAEGSARRRRVGGVGVSVRHLCNRRWLGIPVVPEPGRGHELAGELSGVCGLPQWSSRVVGPRLAPRSPEQKDDKRPSLPRLDERWSRSL